MPASHPNRQSPRARAIKSALLGSLGVLLMSSVAWAATFTYKASHVTSKSPDEVWKIMTAYSQTCDSGCKYTRPNLVTVKKLDYGQTEFTWYTWTHLSNTVKDVKYFTKVHLVKKSDGHFETNNRQLDSSDAALIKTLEKKSGLPHSPFFEGGGTRTVTSTEKGKTKVTQDVTIVAGSVVGMWEGNIREGMRKNVAAAFKNIGP